MRSRSRENIKLCISCCCFAEDGKETYQNVKHTCKSIILLNKPIILFCGVLVAVAVAVAVVVVVAKTRIAAMLVVKNNSLPPPLGTKFYFYTTYAVLTTNMAAMSSG